MAYYISGRNKKSLKDSENGQTLVEAALVFSLIIIVLFAMLSIGLYIYNMTVFVYAANKALDKGVGIMGVTYNSDEIKDIELSEDDIIEIKNTALNSLNIRVFTTEPEIDVMLEEENSELELKVSLTSTYDCGIDVVSVVFPPLIYECVYVQTQ